MSNAEQARAAIYNRLQNAPSYHPASADLFADWSMQPGDVITVQSDGKNYNVPIFGMRTRWNGASRVEIESTGNKHRSGLAEASKRAYSKGPGGGGYWNEKFLHKEFYSEDGYLHSLLDMTESHLRTEFWDDLNSMHSYVEQTASYIRAEVEDVNSGLRSYVEQTASHIYSSVEDNMNSMHSYVEQTASYIRSEVDDDMNSMRSLVEQTASSWRASVEGVVGPDGKVTAASISIAINNAGSEAKINADKIYLLGQTIANQITADYIEDKIATIGTLRGIAASFSGNVTAASIIGQGIYVGSSPPYTNISDGIAAVQITGPSSNIYTLQYKKFSDSTWQDAGSFSRATTLSGAWSSGKLTVTASPQGDTFVRTLYPGTTSWSGNEATVPIVAKYGNSDQYSEDTGKNIYVDASGRYNAGHANGMPSSGTAGGRTAGVAALVHDFTITSVDGTTNVVSIDCTSIYSTARSGYTQGTFTLQDITLQGSAVSCYVEVSSGGTNYYTAGAAVTYYNKGSGFSHYTLSTAGTYYKGNGGSFTVQGSAGPKLYHRGKGQLYYYNAGYKKIGDENTDWYYVSTITSATQYYNAGTTTKYARGDSVSTTTTSGTLLGSAVTVTPIGTKKMLAATTRYAAGTRYNKNKYYTKS